MMRKPRAQIADDDDNDNINAGEWRAEKGFHVNLSFWLKELFTALGFISFHNLLHLQSFPSGSFEAFKQVRMRFCLNVLK
jgi:hypothetical protein